MEYQFESIGPALRWVVLVFLSLFVLAAVAVAAGVAALPGWVARRRNHPQAAAINICGWFGLPTGVLWVVAMVWAYLERGPAANTDSHQAAGTCLNELDSVIGQLESVVVELENLRK